MYYRERPDSKISGLFSPGQGRAVRTEIPAKRAAAHTHITCLAFNAALVDMDLIWFGEMRPAGMYQVAVFIILTDLFADHFLYAVHFEWWQKLTVRHRFYTILIAANANESLYERIPGSYIIIPDWPGNAVTKLFRVLEFVFAPALAGTPPGKRFAANLVAA